jgi:peroxin-1
VAQLTEGFTGADLQALIYSAHLEVVHETINAKTQEMEEKRNVGYHAKDHTHKLRWAEIQPHQPGSLKIADGTGRSRAEKESIRKRVSLTSRSLPTTSSPPPFFASRFKHDKPADFHICILPKD